MTAHTPVETNPMPSPATVIVWFHLRSPELADEFRSLMAGDRDVGLGSVRCSSWSASCRRIRVSDQPSGINVAESAITA
jgi:hypothetical protein